MGLLHRRLFTMFGQALQRIRADSLQQRKAERIALAMDTLHQTLSDQALQQGYDIGHRGSGALGQGRKQLAADPLPARPLVVDPRLELGAIGQAKPG